MWANYPRASRSVLQQRAHDIHIPFSGMPVYHNIKFIKVIEPEIVDAVTIRPEQEDSHGWIMLGCFNTVLVNWRGRDGTRGQGNKGNSEFA